MLRLSYNRNYAIIIYRKSWNWSNDCDKTEENGLQPAIVDHLAGGDGGDRFFSWSSSDSFEFLREDSRDRTKDSFDESWIFDNPRLESTFEALISNRIIEVAQMRSTGQQQIKTVTSELPQLSQSKPPSKEIVRDIKSNILTVTSSASSFYRDKFRPLACSTPKSKQCVLTLREELHIKAQKRVKEYASDESKDFLRSYIEKNRRIQITKDKQTESPELFESIPENFEGTQEYCAGTQNIDECPNTEACEVSTVVTILEMDELLPMLCPEVGLMPYSPETREKGHTQTYFEFRDPDSKAEVRRRDLILQIENLVLAFIGNVMSGEEVKFDIFNDRLWTNSQFKENR